MIETVDSTSSDGTNLYYEFREIADKTYDDQ